MTANPSEHEEQCTVVEWLQLHKVPHFAVPNAQAMSGSNRQKAIRVANKLRKEGMVKGVSDLVILGKGKVLFLEMKRQKGSVTSSEQKEWIKTCLKLGHDAIICKGAGEAIKCIEVWLEDNHECSSGV